MKNLSFQHIRLLLTELEAFDVSLFCLCRGHRAVGGRVWRVQCKALSITFNCHTCDGYGSCVETHTVSVTHWIYLFTDARAGGIGQWEGAHGVDESYSYDPARGRGSGKIILTCLKGVC